MSHFSQSLPARACFVIGIICCAAMSCRNDERYGYEQQTGTHMPIDYLTAVDRVARAHQEILDGPIVVRDVHVAHRHGHRHDRQHPHEHVRMTALQEIVDLIRWIPNLAADSRSIPEFTSRLPRQYRLAIDACRS